MRTHKSLSLIMFLSLATILTTAQAQEQELSGTRCASCIVRIIADPAILPLNAQTVMQLLSSSDVGRGPIRQIIGTEIHGDLGKFIEIEWLSGTLQIGGPAGAGMGMGGFGGVGAGMGGMSAGMSGAGDMSSGMGGGMSGPGGTSAGMGGGMSGPGGMSTGMGGGMSGAGGVGGGMGRAGGMSPGMGGMGGMGGGGMMGNTMAGAMIGGGMGSGGMSGGAPLQSVTFALSVTLPDEANAAAEELLRQLIENLQNSLDRAYEMHYEQLDGAVRTAREQQRTVQTQLDELNGVQSSASERLREILNEPVNMSELSQDMPFSEAIDILKNSVAPPLPIVVLWNELADKASIMPDSPIGMDGLASVKVESALKTLLKAAAGSRELGYRIEDDVIIISTKGPSDEGQTVSSGIGTEVDVMDLVQRRRDLTGNIRKYELRAATSEARQEAIKMQIDETRHEAAKKLSEDSVAQELSQLVDLSEMNLRQVEQQFQAGTISQAAMTEARKKIAEAKIELARRREELGLSAGGRQLSGFSEDLSKLSIEMVENKAALEILRRQLAEVDEQLAQARISDPRARQIQTAQQILAIAEQRVVELNRQLTNLQWPIVTTVGAR